MGWPFTSVNAPNLDTGPGVAVPTGSTSITASQAWILGVHFINNSGGNRVITVTNTAGDLLQEIKVPKDADLPYEFPFRPSMGVKWFADAAGVVGHLWGYV